MIVGALLARNEADPTRYLERVIKNAQQFCDSIVVVDDGSIDDTARFCQNLACDVTPLQEALYKISCLSPQQPKHRNFRRREAESAASPNVCKNPSSLLPAKLDDLCQKSQDHKSTPGKESERQSIRASKDQQPPLAHVEHQPSRKASHADDEGCSFDTPAAEILGSIEASRTSLAVSAAQSKSDLSRQGKSLVLSSLDNTPIAEREQPSTGGWWNSDEAPARQCLWELAVEEAGPDGWIYIFDADHELLGITKHDFQALCRAKHANAWAFPLWDCWDNDKQHRVDGHWQAWRSPRVWLAKAWPTSDFEPKWSREGLHVGHIPSNYPIWAAEVPCGAAIRHLSYVRESHRIKKADRYLSRYIPSI